MKNKILRRAVILVLAFSITSAVSAQGFEISPFGGWFFAGKLPTSQGDLNFKNDVNYGLTIGMNIQRDLQLEFMYNHIDTRVVLKNWQGLSKDLFDTSVNYYHLGAVYETARFEEGIVFTNFSLGATMFGPKNVNFEDKDGNLITALEDDWRFSFAFGGGIKKYISDRVGIRMQLRLLMPVYWAGGSIYIGSGGPGFGLGAGTSLLQGDATLGLIFRM